MTLFKIHHIVNIYNIINNTFLIDNSLTKKVIILKLKQLLGIKYINILNVNSSIRYLVNNSVIKKINNEYYSNPDKLFSNLISILYTDNLISNYDYIANSGILSTIEK